MSYFFIINLKFLAIYSQLFIKNHKIINNITSSPIYKK